MPVPFTTERFYMEHAEEHGERIFERHVRRYRWALSHIREDDHVLDAGCGSGYGGYILTEKCISVLGLDKSKHAIKYARRTARNLGAYNNLSYDVKNLAKLKNYKLYDSKFDVIVCIEVIEHLDIMDQSKFMEGAVSHLKTGGMMLITTPEAGKHPVTEHHLKEFNREEFGTFLSIYFNKVKYDDPAVHGVSSISIDGEESKFLLAVCSNPRKKY